MNSHKIGKVVGCALKNMLSTIPKVQFGLDKTLKDRDEGQEKVYISNMESKFCAT